MKILSLYFCGYCKSIFMCLILLMVTHLMLMCFSYMEFSRLSINWEKVSLKCTPQLTNCKLLLTDLPNEFSKEILPHFFFLFQFQASMNRIWTSRDMLKLKVVLVDYPTQPTNPMTMCIFQLLTFVILRRSFNMMKKLTKKYNCKD